MSDETEMARHVVEAASGAKWWALGGLFGAAGTLAAVVHEERTMRRYELAAMTLSGSLLGWAGNDALPVDMWGRGALIGLVCVGGYKSLIWAADLAKRLVERRAG